MGHPELNSDESILLATQNIVVKSVPFEAILTNERLILVNSRDTLMPPQYLPLAAIQNLDTGENAIRDPTITLSVGTETGSTRQMVLTFSRQVGGERKRECDEWVKILKEKLSGYRERSIHAVAPAFEPEPAPQAGQATPPQAGIPGGSPAKKKIEIARPMKKIIETVNAPQKPVETSSLPQGSFCSRCGSRVPPDSAFCNRCGTRVEIPANRPGTPPATAPDRSVPQVSVPMPPSINPMAAHKERPIEDVIHSIEPLIEDSKPRTQPSPLVPSRHPVQPAATVSETTPAESPAAPAESAESDPVRKNLEMFSNILAPKTDEQAPAAPASSSTADAGAVVAEGKNIPLPKEKAVLPPLPPAVKRSSKKPIYIAGALIIVIIIAVVIGASLFMKGTPGTDISVPTPAPATTTEATPLPTTTVPTPTPVPTPIVATPSPTPAPVTIPANGVWVKVNYAGTFTGSYGTPGALIEVTGTGEQVYQVPTSTGVVVTSFAKNDGSGDVIMTAVYKDGVLIKSDSTSTPKGIAQVQVDLKSIAPVATAPAAPAGNTTAST